MKPYSQACVNNRDPILSVISRLFADRKAILEIGSGTGQHAVYFARKMPHLIWQSSDRVDNHPGIKLWLQEADLINTPPPLELDVVQEPWPPIATDAIFSANTAHIMSWANVVRMLTVIADILPNQGLFILYGPFNYQGRYTSDSNARFDQWLQQRDPVSGIRDFEAINELAIRLGLTLEEDIEMPANNRIVYWRKSNRQP